MNKLLVEVSLGDDCTWSATETRPAFGESPKAFLEALELKWIERSEAIEKVEKEIQDQQNIFTSGIKKITDVEDISQDLVNIQINISDLRKQLNNLREYIVVGGCSFDIDEISAGEEFFAPQVYTLEEYFEHALKAYQEETKKS